MSSRQEEKAQRKLEREERERAAAAAAKRKRLLQIVGGVAIGAVVVVVAVLALAGGGDKRDTGKLATLAKAAGCTVSSFPKEGDEHVEKKLTAADFSTNPPTSGDHNITPAPDGLYAPGNEPELENWVHTLEHGRILFQYAKDTPAATIAKLTTLYNSPVLDSPGTYHSVVMQNNTKMPFAVAGVAWRHYIGCKTFTDKAIPALSAFRDVYVDKAPEQIP